ncbi:MAG: transcriptional regulator GcvA [Hyphomicrobiales bacterium]
MAYQLPPLNGLRAFEATARHMSFTRAADELNVTPAALSYQVRQLEEFLQVKLFNRLNRAIELTEQGRMIFPGLRSGFEEMDRAMQQLAQRSDSQVLVVSAGPAFSAKWLAPRLYRFIERHPNIDPRISANLQISDFEKEQIDLAVRFGQGDYPGLFSVPLLKEMFTPLCSPDLLKEEHPHPVTSPEALRHHTLLHDESVSFMPDAPNWDRWLEAAGVDGIDTRKGLHFSIADHGLDAAVAGAGVVLGRTVLGHADLRSGRLVAPFDLRLPISAGFHVVCPVQARDEPKTAAFIEWLLDEAAEDVAANV